MALQSRLSAGMALVLLCRGCVSRSGCFISSGPSLRSSGGGNGPVGRSAALGSVGGRPLPSELPRASTAAPSDGDGWFSAAGLIGAALCVASAGLHRGKRRQQPRDVSVSARRGRGKRSYYWVYGHKGGEAKSPEWLNPEAKEYGTIGKIKVDVPPWMTESKWRSFETLRMKTRHAYWYMQYFDQDGIPVYDPKNTYTLNQAVDLLMGFAERSPIRSNRTVEANMSFNLDQKFPDQQVRTSIKLPHGVGKEKRVAVFCSPEEEQEALEMGACSAGLPLANDIEAGKIEFDVLLAKPQMMPKLAKLGRVLGPLKLMPSPKSGTVVTEYKAAIEEFKAGSTLEVRTSSLGGIRVPVAQVTMGKQKILDNLRALLQGLVDKRPAGAKDNFWKGVQVKTSKSPSVRISRADLPRVVEEEEDSDED